MKKTVLIFGLFGSFAATAQNKDIQDIQDLIQNKLTKYRIKNEKARVLTPMKRYLERTTPYLERTAPYFLPNGDRVVYGSIDRMPIVQPDMRNFNIMPRVNPWYELPHTMPNAYWGFNDLGVAGSNLIMDQLAPSPVLEKLLKNPGK